MERSEFENLVADLEEQCRRNPRSYKLKVLALALLGYGYIFLILFICLAIVVFLGLMLWKAPGAAYGVIKIATIVFPIIFLIVRSLWVTFPPPEGLDLNLSRAPELETLIHGIRKSLNAPRVDRVITTLEMNACVVQTPRFFLLGPVTNTLIIGFPLLFALSPEGFKAVLAHEFGHLSDAHGKFGGWIYQLRQAWFTIAETFEVEQLWGSFAFRYFFNWYAPVFGAYSFVLARQQEYFADRMGAEIAGRGPSGEALIWVNVMDAFLEDVFWPSMEAEAEKTSAPIQDFVERFEAILSQPVPPDKAQKWLKMACHWKTHSADTHPALSDRLKALGVEPFLPSPPKVSAARTYFRPEVLQELEKNLNEDWKKRVAPIWEEKFKERQQRLARLAELETRGNSLTMDEELERALYVEALNGAEMAFPHYQAILSKNAEHPAAIFGVGGILLNRGDIAGMAYLERAMELQPDCILEACKKIIFFLNMQEKFEEAEKYQARLEKQVEVLEADRQERNYLPFEPLYNPHGLSSEALQPIIDAVAGYQEIEGAFLVQRTLTRRPWVPLYVLGIRLGVKWYKLSDNIYAQSVQISQELSRASVFPGETSILGLHETNEALLEIFRKVPGAVIFHRSV